MIRATPDPQKAFLGVGWSFAKLQADGTMRDLGVHLDPDGTLGESVYEQDIKEAILIILGTNKGERVMRPDFGAGLDAFVFEPVNPTTIAMLQSQVRQALINWEPRIDAQAVDVTFEEPGVLMIDITYTVRATNTVANLVYPFYLDEGDSA
jgi:hypothetical protein